MNIPEGCLHHLWQGARFTHRSCGLCGADQPLPQGRRADGLELVKCDGCGLVYLDPMPDPASLRRLYEREDYFGFKGKAAAGAYRNYERSHRFDVDTRRLDFRLVANQLPTVRGARVLEIGCGLGGLLATFQAAGAVCLGIEPNVEAAHRCTERLGITVLALPFEEAARQLTPGFDAIVAISVLEHVARPGEFLDLAGGLLRPGGVLLVSTPNWLCAEAHGSDWVYWHGAFEHVCYFAPTVLRRACQARGLEPVAEGSAGPVANRRGMSRRTAVKRWKERLKEVPIIGRWLLELKRNLAPERLAPLSTDLADYVGLFRKVAT